MTPKKGTRIVGYVRVSTTEQAAEGVSLDAQRAKLEAWATLHEVELVEVVADEGLSAKSLRRPGLERILEQLRSGAVDGLVVVKLDRLTRSTRDLLGLVEELFADGSRSLVSIAENVDTTSAGGRMVLTMLGAMATWEREVIAERTSEALQHLKAEGVQLGGEGMGWRRTEDVDADGRRQVEAVPEELDTLERATALRKRGLSLRKIAAQLTEEGHATKRGGQWHAVTVRKLLGEHLSEADRRKRAA